MTCTYRALVGLLTLSAMAGCDTDHEPGLEYPFSCYETCYTCCEERHAERRFICNQDCNQSPVDPMSYPDCAAPVENCPRLLE